MKLNIKSETSRLKAVLVGVAYDIGGVPNIELCYDPKSKEHIRLGTFPSEQDCITEINDLIKVFEKYNVMIFRPENIKGLNQIFSRDIAFVVENKLILPNIIEARKKETEAIDVVLDIIADSDKIIAPDNVRLEGGDVIICDDYIFVGYSEYEDFEKYIVARTNRAGLNFLAECFPEKKVKGLQLNKSDDNARYNTLHLDCCFQPIGRNRAILYEGGFKNKEDFIFLINYFGRDNIVEISREEAYNMNSNIFSISEEVIVSEVRFTRLNTKLREMGFIIEEVAYHEVGKMSGLFRCSTMPLVRDY